MRAKTLALAATLLACAAPHFALAHPERPGRRGPYSLELVDEAGSVLPTFQHRGRMYVLGTLGQRYLVRVRNALGRRAEVVVSVDGRDVIDGRPAALEKRGYIIEPYGEVTIDGYRLSKESVAAFRFSSVPRSYASRMGDARDVGVIGVAVFSERPPRYVPPLATPYESPHGDGRSAESRRDAAPGGSGEVGAGPAPSSAPPSTALRDSRRAERPGLGTEFGEEHGSRVYQVSFERASSRPDAVLTLRYDDRQGLLALGIDVDGRGWSSSDDSRMRETANPFRRSSFAEPPPGWRSQ